jgi:serine/threonine protein kinase
MQQSSMVLFCSQCGLANDPTATHCSFCQHVLVALAPPPEEQLSTPPIVVTPPALQQIPADNSSLLNQKRGPVDVQRGTILSGKYRIEEEIGQGGFSLVYRGKELGSKRQVAIKRIPLSALTTRQIIDATETLNREFLMLSRFGGLRGIPKLYQKLADAENWYLIMEYIEGQTLEEYLRAAPGGYLPEEEVAKIGEELAYMLQTLHFSQPFAIFRDVKPANVMITPRGKLYLIDFGIARFFTPGKTKDTTPFGSPGYASPEQYGRAQTDQRADIYSLGATL